MIKTWYYNTKADNLFNAGDMFGPYLLKQFGIDFEKSEDPDFMSVGSIMVHAKPHTLVWGSGSHNQGDYFRYNDKRQILAVRGKLTQQSMLFDFNKKWDFGYKCVIGDPGLLLSKVYTPKTTKKYKFGIISHYTDYSDFKKFETPNMPVINMLGRVEEIADKINECEFVFSSSLHGIIFAHSLGIPAVHIENKPLVSRGNFKFKDYYSIYDNIQYQKIPFSKLSNDVIDYCLSNKELFLPDKERVDFTCYSLLMVFPYEIKNDKISKFMEEYKNEHYMRDC